MIKQAAALQVAMKKINYVEFDPTNREHVKAFAQFEYCGQQHPTLRFVLKAPFLDVRTMIRSMIAEQYVRNIMLIDPATETFERVEAEKVASILEAA